MTEFNRGDAVLVKTQLPGSEEPSLRPALVISSETYRRGRQQLVVAAITGSPGPLQPGDTAVGDWRNAGLLGPSVITGVLLTLSEGAIERRLGTLEPQDLSALEASLHLSLGL